MRRPVRLVVLTVWSLVAAHPPAHAQAAARGRGSIRGTVTGAGQPLAGVLVVRIGSADSTRSDSLGRYALTGLGAGRHIVQFRKRGFAPIEAEVTFPDDSTGVNADVPLEPAASDAQFQQKLEQAGFVDRRRRARAGDHVTFVGPDEIAERAPHRVSQLFDPVPDVTVRTERGIQVLYGGDGRCVMYVWIDGQLIETAFPPAGSSAPSSRRAAVATRYTGLDELLPLEQVGALEIYPRPAQVPQRFQRSNQQIASGRAFETRSAECGALIIWTR
jgi:hypothetical protein